MPITLITAASHVLLDEVARKENIRQAQSAGRQIAKAPAKTAAQNDDLHRHFVFS